jgi:hypothetical protein
MPLDWRLELGVQQVRSDASACLTKGHSFSGVKKRIFVASGSALQSTEQTGFCVFVSRTGTGVGVSGIGGTWWQIYDPSRSQDSVLNHPIAIVATGLGVPSNQTWVLLHAGVSTSRFKVTIDRGNLSVGHLTNGFFVLAVTGRAMPWEAWESHQSLTVDIGTITGFDSAGFVTGVDKILVCSWFANPNCPAAGT